MLLYNILIWLSSNEGKALKESSIAYRFALSKIALIMTNILSQFDLVFPAESRYHKAPSGRELSSKMTEGECVDDKIQLRYIAAQAPSTTSWSPSLSEGGFGEM